MVDHSNIRTNQAFTIGLLALAFVLDIPLLAAFVGVVLLISALFPPLGLFRLIYLKVLRPSGLVKPDVIADNAEPHRFSQGLGGTVVSLGFVALLAGVEVLGWGLMGLVIVLASLNLFAGWCAGCTLYYLLNRLGVPGFHRSRIEVTQ
ncbi:MAG TPA: DUF4395 domain-containing protein [Aggregatilineaceae bacterium]|nr:DUF4395 domain-containing protein [Aggregatilineaceae bacterium]